MMSQAPKEMLLVRTKCLKERGHVTGAGNKGEYWDPTVPVELISAVTAALKREWLRDSITKCAF